MKRVISVIAAVGAAAGGAFALAGSAGAAPGPSALPTLRITLTGTKGVTVSGDAVSGAVSVVSTFSGKAPRGNNGGPELGLLRLDPGVTFEQAAAAVNEHHGDPNALDGLATLVATAAPGTMQTVLSPGNWVALNVTSQGTPGAAPFTVAPSASPARLPSAKAIETEIDFAFRGPRVLHDGTLVRSHNAGYSVHMSEMISVRSKAAGDKVAALLRAGKGDQAFRFANRTGSFELQGSVSPGGLQQQVLHARHGWYVQACFMDTQDGREHVQLGMVRLVRVVR
jgi:hypothetical protein